MRLFTTCRTWTALAPAVKQVRADQAKAADQAAMADMEDLFGSEAESEAERKGATGGRAPRMGAWGVGLLSGRRRGAGQRGAPTLLPSAPCMPGGANLSRETGAESVPGGSGTGQDSLGSRREDEWPSPLRSHLAD